MSELKQGLLECKRICDKYESSISGYAQGGLYVDFCDEVINMAFLIAICDENVTAAEINLINNTFDKNNLGLAEFTPAPLIAIENSFSAS